MTKYWVRLRKPVEAWVIVEAEDSLKAEREAEQVAVEWDWKTTYPQTVLEIIEIT